MQKWTTRLILATAVLAVMPTAATAQQQVNWENYCTVGDSPLCSSVELGLTPEGGWTNFSIRLRNLEGTLGTTPWALYNVSFANLLTNNAHGGLPQVQGTLSGTSQFLITADSATCATYLGVGGGCPGRAWGTVEWDAGNTHEDGPQRGYVGSHTDVLPKPFGIVGCDAPPQPPTSSIYWGAGYFQTCGDGWVTFDFGLVGDWMFDEQSSVSITAWDGANFSSCTLDQTCLQQELTATPEPVTMSLMATGLFTLGGFAGVRRRRARRQPS